MAKETQATDYLARDTEAVIDFSALPVGGYSIQPITEREFDFNKPEEVAAYEKFMAMPIVVKIHSSSDPNAPTVCEVGLNGVKVTIPRDKPVRIPRAFVENIARSQTRGYRQERIADPMADEGMRTRRFIGTDYPMAILEDKHPKGRAWLERITRESA